MVERIAVIGAGTMGRGIAEVAAARGLHVDIIEVNREQQEVARKFIAGSLDKAAKRGKLTVAPAEVIERMTWHEDFAVVAQAEFVIEAVSESEPIKIDVHRRLDALCPPEIVIASNTSSISITRLAAMTRRPDKIVGMHFFNPVPIMAPIEIVRGLLTSDATVEATRQLAEQLGKQALVVKDSPGFVVNRVLMPLLNEAMLTLQEGIADAATIDALMKLGCNHPMGPLELADLVGLDVCLSILRVLYDEFGDPKFHPCPLLVRMVDAGQLGRKSGAGFYTYT